MDQQEPIRFRADSVKLLNIIIKYRKILLITAFSALVVSTAISFFIKPLFRSTVILYPANTVSQTQSLFGIQKSAIPQFGDEEATEKVLQILKSDNIRDFIVAKYDLMNHYGISPNARYKYTMLEMKLKKYIVSRKTQYNSVEINVLDPDPQTAANIANDISHRIDTAFNQIVREAGKKTVIAINTSYSDQLTRVKAIGDSIRILSATSAVVRHSSEINRLMNILQSENESLSAIRNRQTDARMSAEESLPYIHIINDAKVAEKKAFPERSVIVIVSLVSALLLMIFILAAGEMIRKDEQ
jgi:uncharacterized protein involved in exopolysaccharide biosynthesis